MKALRISQLCVVAALILVLCVAWSAAGPQQMSGKQLDGYHGAGDCGAVCKSKTCPTYCRDSNRGYCPIGEPSDCCSFADGGAGDGCNGGGTGCYKTKCSDC